MFDPFTATITRMVETTETVALEIWSRSEEYATPTTPGKLTLILRPREESGEWMDDRRVPPVYVVLQDSPPPAEGEKRQPGTVTVHGAAVTPPEGMVLSPTIASDWQAWAMGATVQEGPFAGLSFLEAGRAALRVITGLGA